jgi:hypothetical protein
MEPGPDSGLHRAGSETSRAHGVAQTSRPVEGSGLLRGETAQLCTGFCTRLT